MSFFTNRFPFATPRRRPYRAVRITRNAEGKRASPAKIDPSRTGTLRKQFVADVTRRFKALRKAIIQLVLEEDAFGLIEAEPLSFNAERQRWRFQSDPQKLKSFKAWLQDQIDKGILSAADSKDAFTAKYIDSAYKKGLVRAYTDSHKADLVTKDPGVFGGSQAQFLRSSFGQPETKSKLELIYTRSYDSLKNVTSSMATEMSRTLVDGLSNGIGAQDLANKLAGATGVPLSRARTIARTEVIHAHAEGQLDAFEELGVEELGVMAEWSTAGDDHVCEECEPLEGVIMTVEEARGMIPRHPNCRCTWIPAEVGENTKDQVRTKGGIDRAITESLLAETGEETKEDAKDASDWVGADKTLRGKPPRD